MVRRYIQKWDSEINAFATHPGHVQSIQLRRILNSPLVKYLHPLLLSHGDKPDLTDIPISDYQDISEGVQNMMQDRSISCRYYAQSSGTTSGTQKLIPTPEAYVKSNHLRGSWYLLHTLYRHDPDMSVFKQKNLLIGGSLYKKTHNYTIGDVSGIMISRIPSFFRPWYVPSIEEAVLPDWEEKLSITSKKASREKKVALLAGTPTWVLSVLRAVLESSGTTTLSKVWPQLKAYIHGGVDFGPYRTQFNELVEDASMRYIEVYNASEGFFAYQDRPHEDGMLLMLASGIYYEFIAESDYKLGIYDLKSLTEVDLDVNYVMVISTISGLVRYVQGDIIRFVSAYPYRVKVVSRIGTFINAFGEDLSLNQVQSALRETNQLYNAQIAHYHVAPSFISIQEKGRHDWLIEWEKEPNDIDAYLYELDNAVKRANPNYAQKRVGDIALERLQIINLPEGTTKRYFKAQGKLSAQSKLQCMRNDRKVADRLIQLKRETHASFHEISPR